MLVNTLHNARACRWNGELPTELLPDRPGPDPDWADGLAVRRALAAMSPAHREVLVLRYYVDLSEREIAEVLGVAPGTVKSRAAPPAPDDGRFRLGPDQVPSVFGLTAEQTVDELEQLGLRGTIATIATCRDVPGRALWTRPATGTLVAAGTEVTVTTAAPEPGASQASWDRPATPPGTSSTSPADGATHHPWLRR